MIIFEKNVLYATWEAHTEHKSRVPHLYSPHKEEHFVCVLICFWHV